MRMPPNKRLLLTLYATTKASKRGGMRMPPNVGLGDVVGEVGGASKRGGMRMPPNRQRRGPAALHDRGFKEGRHAHAAESDISRSARNVTNWCFKEGRHAHAAESHRSRRGQLRILQASKRGGMRMPPNSLWAVTPAAAMVASKRGGMRMPPNAPGMTRGSAKVWLQRGAACACRRISGQRMPSSTGSSFKEGRHAHAAESAATSSSHPPTAPLQRGAACACRRMTARLSAVNTIIIASKRGGMRMPPNTRWMPCISTPVPLQRGAACACRRIP